MNGRIAAIRGLVELGADPNGEGVPPLHLAVIRPAEAAPPVQAGQEAAVDLLLELGADPTMRDAIHGGTPAGWAAHGCRPDLAERLE